MAAAFGRLENFDTKASKWFHGFYCGSRLLATTTVVGAPEMARSFSSRYRNKFPDRRIARKFNRKRGWKWPEKPQEAQLGDTASQKEIRTGWIYDSAFPTHSRNTLEVFPRYRNASIPVSKETDRATSTRCQDIQGQPRVNARQRISGWKRLPTGLESAGKGAGKFVGKNFESPELVID